MVTTQRIAIQPRQGPPRMKAFALLACAVAGAVGFFTPFLIHIVGDLPVGELLACLLLPVLIFMRGRQMMRPTIRPILILMGLWLAGQILTDIYRQTGLVDWLRGDANILFLGIDLLALVALLGKDDRRKVYFIVGYSIGHILAARFQPTREVNGDAWKFGYEPGVILLVVLLSCVFYRRRNYFMTIVLVAAMAVANVLMNYRNPVLSLMIMIALTVPLIPERVGRLHLLPAPKTTARVLVLAALAMGAGLVALAGIQIATMTGLIGHKAQQKNEMQAQSPAGMLIGGRPEILVSSRAIFDSPLLGHGSWAREPKYTEMLLDVMSHYGVQAPPDYSDEKREGLIPSHSLLFGSWVSAGVFGGVFWIYMIRRTIKGTVAISTLKGPLAPMYAFLAVHLLWDILFSPLGSASRMTIALSIVILADAVEAMGPAKNSAFFGRRRSGFQQDRRFRPSFR